MVEAVHTPTDTFEPEPWECCHWAYQDVTGFIFDQVRSTDERGRIVLTPVARAVPYEIVEGAPIAEAVFFTSATCPVCLGGPCPVCGRTTKDREGEP